jgi:hypothetical protein
MGGGVLFGGLWRFQVQGQQPTRAKRKKNMDIYTKQYIVYGIINTKQNEQHKNVKHLTNTTTKEHRPPKILPPRKAILLLIFLTNDHNNGLHNN